MGALTASARSVSQEWTFQKDGLYDNLTEPFTLSIEGSPRPEILVRGVRDELYEGSTMRLQVALATPPSSDVNVTLGLGWTSGEERSVNASATVISFGAGEALVWKDLDVVVTDSEQYLGNSTLAITASAASDSIVYDSSQPLGAPAKNFEVLVMDTGELGVCLGPGKCRRVTKYDFKFDGSDQDLVVTPYEVKLGKVRLRRPYFLFTHPVYLPQRTVPCAGRA
jgi:hypothetical protein